MEMIQCTENDTETVAKTEPIRVQKRNIAELAVDNKINGDFKSPARKEVKVSHETHLSRELEQWKELMNEKGIRHSITPREGLNTEPLDSDTILKEDQKNFINGAVDVRKMVQESHDFRKKFDFFIRLNKVAMNVTNENSTEALSRGKQQQIKIRVDSMHCCISKFFPVEN